MATTPKKKAAPAAKKGSGGDSASKTVKFQDFTIKTKRSGRYWVIAKSGKSVNGAEKTKILVGAKLLKESAPKPKEEAAPST